MPSNMNNLGESLHLCFSKLKPSTGRNIKKISYSSSTAQITKQPPPPPLPPPHQKTETAVGLFINKYFNSLYHPSDTDADADDEDDYDDEDYDDPSSQGPAAEPPPPHVDIHYSTNYISSSSNSVVSVSSSSFSTSSEQQQHDPVEVAAVPSDGRFFFSSPGKSKSLVDDDAMTLVFRDDGSGGKKSNGLFIFAAVPTYSSDPYAEFKRSMEEMVAARGLMDDDDDDADADDNDGDGGPVSLYLWDYLHGLLLCYLVLNRKNTHKFILEAFNHLLLSISPPPHATA